MADRRKSVVLLSGGLDSAANLAFCVHFDEAVLAVTVDYGQRAFSSEFKAAQSLAKHFKVPHMLIDAKWLGQLGGNALTDNSSDVPTLLENQLDDVAKTKGTAKAVWVSNRNGVLINIAAAIAESKDIAQVIVGFNKEEAATFPDNSSQFINVTNLALRYSTANGVKVACYTDMLDKTGIVAALRRLPDPFPFELVWSCYLSAEKPCGVCESCRRFNRAISSS